MALFVAIVGDLADAEADDTGVRRHDPGHARYLGRGLVAGLGLLLLGRRGRSGRFIGLVFFEDEGEGEQVELLLAQVVGPPDPGSFDDELRRRLRGELEFFRFLRPKGHFPGETQAFDPTFEGARDVRVGVIHELRRDREPGFLESLEVELGDDERILDGDSAGGPDADLPEEAHVVVRRRRIPVDEADRRLALLRRDDLDGQDVLLRRLDVRGDVDREAPEGAVGRRRVGHFFPVEPDIGPVVDAVELEPRLDETGSQRHSELLAVPPGDGEGRCGDGLEVLPEEEVRIDVVLDERPEDGRGDDGRIPRIDLEAGLGDLLPGPLGLLGGLDVPEVAEADGALEGHPGLGLGLGPVLHRGPVLGRAGERERGQHGQQAEGRGAPGERSRRRRMVGDHDASRVEDTSIISEEFRLAKRLGLGARHPVGRSEGPRG